MVYEARISFKTCYFLAFLLYRKLRFVWISGVQSLAGECLGTNSFTLIYIYKEREREI
jgi:hypothetical protein